MPGKKSPKMEWLGSQFGPSLPKRNKFPLKIRPTNQCPLGNNGNKP